MPFCAHHQHAFVNVCSFCVIDEQQQEKKQQLQMLTLFGFCKVGDRISTPDCREFVKESHNKARLVNDNEQYYFDRTDRVYVNVGQSEQIATRYFGFAVPQLGSMVNVHV